MDEMDEMDHQVLQVYKGAPSKLYILLLRLMGVGRINHMVSHV